MPKTYVVFACKNCKEEIKLEKRPGVPINSFWFATTECKKCKTVGKYKQLPDRTE